MATISKLRAVLSLDNSKFKAGLKDSEKQTKGLGTQMAKVGGIIAAAFSVKAIADFGIKMAQLSGQLKNVGRAFDRLGGERFLRDLRAATGGMIGDLELMRRAVQAVNLGLDKTKLAGYFEFATIRAAETGESVDYLVNSIVTGIGRKSILVLDNLGISAVELQQEFKKTGDFAKAASNIIERLMGENETSIDDVADSVTQMNANWANFTEAIAKEHGPAIAALIGKLDELYRGTEAPLFEKDKSGLFDDAFLSSIGVDELQKRLDAEKEVRDRMFKEWNEDQIAGFGTTMDAEYDIALENIEKIQSLFDGLNVKKLTGEFEKEFANILAASRDLVAGLYVPVTHGQMGAPTVTPMQSLDISEGIDLNTDALENGILAVDKYKESLSELEPVVLDLSKALAQSLGQAIMIMSDSIGQLIGGDTEGALNSFISGIAGLMKQFGALLVAWGVAQLAIKVSAGNPYVAIAAGAALIAIGGLMSAKQSQVTGSNYYSGGGSYGSYGGGSYGGGYYTDQREIILVARGKDLVTVLNKQNNQDDYYG